jgi:hypothetical protein
MSASYNPQQQYEQQQRHYQQRSWEYNPCSSGVPEPTGFAPYVEPASPPTPPTSSRTGSRVNYTVEDYMVRSLSLLQAVEVASL